MTDKKDDSPGVVKCNVGINYTIWEEHEDRLNELKEECPDVAMGDKPRKKSSRVKGSTKLDDWGCLWQYPDFGLEGQVLEHPLDTWDKYESWQPPSAEEKAKQMREAAAKRKEEGKDRKATVHMEHGFMFLRLTYMRGYENFMLDLAMDNPRIYEVRDIVSSYWRTVVETGIELGVKQVHCGDDLGHQDRLPISPDMWRRFMKPAFANIYEPAKERGIPVHMHTDGYIMDIIDDLVEVGVTTLNPQDLVNGLENLERDLKGKINIHLDIDRQSITVFGTPAEIDAHIEKCIRTLGSPEGGLSIIWGVYPGTPIENIEACVRALQKYRTMWA